jgi:hypothetical protein
MTSKGRADLSERYERSREDEARWSGYMRDAQEDDNAAFDSLLREILPKAQRSELRTRWRSLPQR